ncbi:uncharacterized protein LOC124439061 isoform X2 [Xenia sp. Carnegie-2017]|uniref:uncharacterized protein LOC124439061 isoform X2 n=1 Tax=Xenia sp. Carnegie-2017 TaxID=2897299 RepID=UPI001F04FDE5|nr:uncharacterized protein LOC124439061 isoform X2 [Xenia sp. Carnegie-2017]
MITQLSTKEKVFTTPDGENLLTVIASLFSSLLFWKPVLLLRQTSMNISVFFLSFFVFLCDNIQGQKYSNQECKDLDRIQKSLTTALKQRRDIPVTASCKPNNNCTGVECSGTANGKKFRSIVILEACHTPVRMKVYLNNKVINITNDFEYQLPSKDATKAYLVVKLARERNVVYITVNVKGCFLTFPCVSFPIVENQRVHVHCNASVDPTSTSYSTAAVTNEDESKNPECKGLNNAKKQIERSFNNFPSYAANSIFCYPATNCTELRCDGVFNGYDFNTTILIDYCSDPIDLRVAIDVPRKNIHYDHRLKNKKPYKILKIGTLTVHIRRSPKDRNVIYLSMKLTLLFVSKDLIKNISVRVDPSHCHGKYLAFPQIKSEKCEKMTAVAKMVEERLFRDHKKDVVQKCSVMKTCEGIHCYRKSGSDTLQIYTRIDPCNSTLFVNSSQNGKVKCMKFKNGKNFQMKRFQDMILFNVSFEGFGILRNAEIQYDPNDCREIQYDPNEGNSFKSPHILVCHLLLLLGLLLRSLSSLS